MISWVLREMKALHKDYFSLYTDTPLPWVAPAGSKESGIEALAKESFSVCGLQQQGESSSGRVLEVCSHRNKDRKGTVEIPGL